MTGKSPAKKLYIKTHGCQMNEYDSDKMADVLNAGHGLELTQDENEADVILINTCSIREKAQEKVFSQLGRWRELKARNPDLVIGVGGCVASQEGEAILKRAPYVDLVFGPQTLHRLPEMIDAKRGSGKPQVDISFPEIEKFDHLPKPRAEGPTAFVSIMEGCSKYCSFCVVPYTRGEEVSRPFDDVLLEVLQLAQQGVREVNLLGQNVNAYRGAIDGSDETADLAMLIRAIAQIEAIGRIRYTTSHPLEFSDALIEAHRDVDKLASYLHLPVQSGSGYIFFYRKFEEKLYVWEYEIKTDKKDKSTNRTQLQLISEGNIDDKTLTEIIDTNSRWNQTEYYKELPIFEIKCAQNFPFEQTMIPIIKRKVMSYIFQVVNFEKLNNFDSQQ